ncbi:MAG: response regulator transcription factor [Tissierellaceae bacterium]|nr:response regulator transcription factor [Tissierellaceae bacterium]
MNNKIKVMLIDDHNIVRDGLKMLIQLNEDILVCGEAGSLEEAMDVIPKADPDVILLDFKLPDGDGVNGCNLIKRNYPDIKVIILTAYSQNHLVMETIRAGADGYLLKNIQHEVLINTIKMVHDGAHILDPSVSKGVINNIQNGSEKNEDDDLSPRESDILKLISTGKSNKEIAEALSISDKTVRNYISNIFKKINVTNRTEAACYWLRKPYNK